MALSEIYSNTETAKMIENGLNDAIPYDFQLMDFNFNTANGCGVLIACIKKGQHKEFVTWEFSLIDGEFSVFWGHYFPVFKGDSLWTEYGNAYSDYFERAGIKINSGRLVKTV
jgi:hypothetical protein